MIAHKGQTNGRHWNFLCEHRESEDNWSKGLQNSEGKMLFDLEFYIQIINQM